MNNRGIINGESPAGRFLESPGLGKGSISRLMQFIGRRYSSVIRSGKSGGPG